MDRQYYLDLAARGLRMPIGTDIVLHEQPDHPDILRDGDRLGKVVAETAHRYGTPLAVPHMNLELEKAVMLETLGIPPSEVDTYKLSECPTDEMVATVHERFDPSSHAKLNAHINSVGWVARNTDLLPVGMSIGPFSLMSKLLADPITPIYLAGTGVTPEDDESVRTLERTLDMALTMVLRNLDAQLRQGVKAVFIAEPAANKVFVSPRQMENGSDGWERFVMQPNRRVAELLAAHGVDLIFHDCGELTDQMVRAFTTLRPVVLSLGSSRHLWEDAALVPNDIVLFGNLPSKRFYSDDLFPLSEVKANAEDLLAKMKATGHPFILGSECDILSVPGCEGTIAAKAAALAGL